jgi:hypothetical protein
MSFLFLIAMKQELTNVDVLVCGLCHVGFHFIEEFQEHKVGGTCKKISAFRDQNSAVLVNYFLFITMKSIIYYT